MATLFKRNGIWYINYIDGNGNRVKRSLGVKDKKLAELKLKEIEIALARGKLGFAVDIKLSEFVEKFLSWSKATKSPGTYEIDRISVKNLMDYFGNVKLSQITSSKLEGWKIWLVETVGLSKVGANTRIRHIKAMLSRAVEWNYLENNPAERLKQYKVPNGRPDFLTEEEVKKVFSVIDNPTHLAIFNLIYLTGMRISEAINLEWQDIDMENGFIRVRSKKNWNTKNYRERVIPIHSKLYNHLLHLESIRKDDRVIPYKSRRYIARLMENYGKKVNIKVSPHLLRHSIATALASKGVSLQAIKEILGHSDYTTTLIYAKMTDDYKRKALEIVFNDK